MSQDMRYRILEVSGATRGRVAGFAALDPSMALTDGCTVAIVGASAKDSAEKRAGSRLRTRIMRLAESAGSGATLAMLRSVKPGDLERMIDRMGGLQFTDPNLGTFAVLPESDVLTPANAIAMARESAAAYASAYAALGVVDSIIDAGREVAQLPAGE